MTLTQSWFSLSITDRFRLHEKWMEPLYSMQMCLNLNSFLWPAGGDFTGFKKKSLYLSLWGKMTRPLTLSQYFVRLWPLLGTKKKKIEVQMSSTTKWVMSQRVHTWSQLQRTSYKQVSVKCRVNAGHNNKIVPCFPSSALNTHSNLPCSLTVTAISHATRSDSSAMNGRLLLHPAKCVSISEEVKN